MNVLVKYPTRARPKLFARTLELYLRDPIVRVLVTADLDDEEMNCSEMRDFLTRDRVKMRWGNCKSKVEACNDGLVDEPWDGLVVLASDDMTPQRPDYAQRILGLFDEFFPDGDGVLHLNDGRNGKSLNSLCVTDRKYFDRFGYLYYAGHDGRSGYQSVFCDNEFQEVSERLGRAIYVNECIIRHDWIGNNPDDLHLRNEGCWARDEKIFRARQSAGFP